MEPLWLLWGGVVMAAVGFSSLWAPLPLSVLSPDTTEAISRWVTRAGLTVAVMGAAAHVFGL